MLDTATILFFSFGYMGLLFAVAYIADRHAEIGKSLVSNPYVYALSLAVYCTAWTFYGSVGRAVRDGPGFLTIYLGPTLMFILGWVVIRKIIRICKVHHITSIPDFIGSRYAKSTALGGLVTVIAVLGVVPYIALQLKAVSTSFLILHHYPSIDPPIHSHTIPILKDTAFYVALILAAFAIIFGTRHLEATERHEGLVAAIAFESIVKLVAFLAVGIFVTYYMYDGPGDLFAHARSRPDLTHLLVLPRQAGTYMDWSIYLFLSMMAVLFLPRQFQVAVVENVNETHLHKAVWLFPLYMVLINLFVLPVAVGGLLHFPDGGADADTFVLTLPMAAREEVLAFLAYIGGASAATGMVIMETVALSTMICNQLVMPVFLRLSFFQKNGRGNVSTLLLGIRRGAILLVLLLAYVYFRLIGEYYPLVSIGLVSFAAVAQFAPAMLGGIFWKGGTRKGAFWGLIAGFLVWTYTLFLPSLVPAGWMPESFVNDGPFGIGLLRPFHLFGLEGFSHITHSVFWSMLANFGVYLSVSLITKPSAMEHAQAAVFVNLFAAKEPLLWRGTVSVPDLRSLLERFLGEQRTAEALARYGTIASTGDDDFSDDAGLVSYAEKLLSGAIGTASARVLVATVVKEEPMGLEEVMDILDETRQVITYSRELEKATTELRAANERLKELDRLKDEFISTVTHELRTPITAIRSLAEILQDTPDLELTRREEFLGIVIKESERLSRLVTQVLDFQKMESGRVEWQEADVNLLEVVEDAVRAVGPLIRQKGVRLETDLPPRLPPFKGDRDRLVQALVNLISNAVKFCDSEIGIQVRKEPDRFHVQVRDDGIGIRVEDQTVIFEKFRQVKQKTKGRPSGTGLGLSITRRIVEHHNGRIWVESEPGRGARFCFTLPATIREGEGTHGNTDS